MLNVHLYGFIKKKFVREAKLSESTVIKIDFIENESFSEFLTRLNINESEIGDCFINGYIANKEQIIPENARIGLFSFGMCLLDGGQHIKGHGFVTKPAPVKINTW